MRTSIQGASRVCVLAAYLVWHLRRAWAPGAAIPLTLRK